jgi:hypothetical protein
MVSDPIFTNVGESINWVLRGDEKVDGYNVVKDGMSKFIPSATQQQIDSAYSLSEVASAGLLLKAPVKVYESIYAPGFGFVQNSNFIVTPYFRTPAAYGEALGANWDAWNAAYDGAKKR